MKKGSLKIIVMTCHPVNDGRILKHWSFLKNNYDSPDLIKIRWKASEEFDIPDDWKFFNIPWNNNLLKRLALFREASFKAKPFGIDFDKLKESSLILHIHDPELLLTSLVLKFRFPFIRLIYDRHEYHSLSHFSIRELEIAFWEKFFSRKIDGIVVVTDEMVEEIQKRFRTRTFTQIIPNYPSKTMFNKEMIMDKVESIEKTREIRFVYFGSLSCQNRNIKLILDVCQKILSSFPDAQIRIGGRNISNEDLLKAQFLEKQYPNSFFYIGEVPYETVIAETTQAHFGFLAISKDKQGNQIKSISNNKLQEYLFTGTIPLISLGNTLNSLPQKFFISLDDINLLAKIRLLNKNKRLRLEIVRHGQSFSWEEASEKYRKIYQQVTD